MKDSNERLKKQLLYIEYCVFCIKKDARLVPPLPRPDDGERTGDYIGEIDRLRFALEHIMFIGMDCPAGDDPAAFYKSGLGYAVSTAARVLLGEDLRKAKPSLDFGKDAACPLFGGGLSEEEE